MHKQFNEIEFHLKIKMKQSLSSGYFLILMDDKNSVEQLFYEA